MNDFTATDAVPVRTENSTSTGAGRRNAGSTTLDLRGTLEPVFRAIEIAGPASIAFAGRQLDVASAADMNGTTGASEEARAVLALQNEFYARCYTRRFDPADPFAADREQRPADPRTFADGLSAAAPRAARWDPGWKVERSLPSGQFALNKFGTMRTVWPGEFMTHDGPGMAPRTGAVVSLHVPSDSRTLQHGFHFYFSATPGDTQDDCDIVRFYWNVPVHAAAGLAREVTGALDAYAVPFRFKTLSAPEYYGRRDAAVLFITRRMYHIVADLLADVHARFADALGEDVPLFTKPLARGLGLAEDPGNGESFGMQRCRLIAEGVWAAWRKGGGSVTGRLRETEAAFARAGVDPLRPWLNRTTRDDYHFNPTSA